MTLDACFTKLTTRKFTDKQTLVFLLYKKKVYKTESSQLRKRPDFPLHVPHEYPPKTQPHQLAGKSLPVALTPSVEWNMCDERQMISMHYIGHFSIRNSSLKVMLNVSLF